jgi:predicted Fe-Mo cluster-binding NifX family protein
MIAIPVKTNKENPPVSTLFGKSKWFAMVDGEGNESGREVVENMIKKGVNKLVFHHMGGNPFMLLQKANIECFHDGGKRILLDEALDLLKNNQLTQVDGLNMSEYIEQGNMHNGGGNHSHDHDHHEHSHSHNH